MSKNVRRLVEVGVIVLLLLVLLIRNKSPFGKNNSSFASQPKSGITKIEFSTAKQTLSLEKEGDNWLLNGKVETRKTAVLFIIRILEEIKIKSPVSPELFESEISEKGIEPVRVKVFERRKLLKSFFVYKTNSNVYGNIMKMKSGSLPFIVYMPGFEGDIGSGFTMNELFWQPYTVFNLLPSEIASVDFENLSDTVNSFTIKSTNRKYTLSDRSRDLIGWDTALVDRYLSYFTRIPFESWAFELGEEQTNKIEKKQPLYRITVSATDGSRTILSLWERMSDGGGTDLTDSDRLIGKTDKHTDFFVIRYFDIDPLLKKRLYFFPI